MITVSLSETVSECDCCGREGLTKTFKIDSPVYDPLYLGYKCTSKWFHLNMSGNKFAALSRLAWKLEHHYRWEELEQILGNIKSSQEEWMEDQ